MLLLLAPVVEVVGHHELKAGIVIDDGDEQDAEAAEHGEETTCLRQKVECAVHYAIVELLVAGDLKCDGGLETLIPLQTIGLSFDEESVFIAHLEAHIVVVQLHHASFNHVHVLSADGGSQAVPLCLRPLLNFLVLELVLYEDFLVLQYYDVPRLHPGFSICFT